MPDAGIHSSERMDHVLLRTHAYYGGQLVNVAHMHRGTLHHPKRPWVAKASSCVSWLDGLDHKADLSSSLPCLLHHPELSSDCHPMNS
jgi:hypothetical protein